MQSELTAKEQRLMRSWFRKTDENTIEITEKKWGFVKVFFIALMIGWVYYDFIEPHYQKLTWRELEYSFQPMKAFEKSWAFYQDYENPNITKAGQSKEDFMKENWDDYWSGYAWWGYFTIGKYVLVLLCFLRPTI
ncbi:hypothetical protein [Rodentibacter caecimuris]|uniref:hypothetical protein n=1 Tax=Rodentibacter caecimuris TaxID=1796644 RepID=UPI00258A9E62|nr:hypothetical protein [Rodentibacter heylii]